MLKLLVIVIGLLVLSGCKEKAPDVLVMVKVVKVHRFGETVKTGGVMNEPFTHTIYENIETKERFASNRMYGAVNDTIAILKSKF